MTQTTAHPASDDLHVRHIGRVVAEEYGGEATVEDIVRLMLEIGWTPPVVRVRRIAAMSETAELLHLRACLAPLAAIAAAIDDRMEHRRPDDARLWCANETVHGDLDLTMGHARAARSALAAVGSAETNE